MTNLIEVPISEGLTKLINAGNINTIEPLEGDYCMITFNDGSTLTINVSYHILKAGLQVYTLLLPSHDD